MHHSTVIDPFADSIVTDVLTICNGAPPEAAANMLDKLNTQRALANAARAAVDLMRHTAQRTLDAGVSAEQLRSLPEVTLARESHSVLQDLHSFVEKAESDGHDAIASYLRASLDDLSESISRLDAILGC